MQKAIPFVLVALSLVGMWLSMDLTDKHFQIIHQPELAFDSLCEVNETVSCSKVNGSKWSAISLGEGRAELPVSVPGVGFYAMVLLLALMAAFEAGRRQKALAWIAATAVPGIAFGLYLVVIQAFFVKAWCLFCLALDVTTVATAAAAFVGHGGGVGGILADLKEDTKLGLIAGVILLGVTGFSYSNYSGKVASESKKQTFASSSDDKKPEEHTEDDGHGHGATAGTEDMSPEEKAKALEQARTAVAEFVKAWPTTEAKTITINPFDGIKGTPDTGIVFVEFADFDCPHCKMAGWFLKDIAQRYGDHASFVFKHYPLGKDCNSALTRDIHPNACEAAVGTQCARRQGLFWEFHDHTFDNQGNLGTKTMMKVADQLGLDRAEFEECLNRDTLWDEVRHQVGEGRELGITGTPSMFVNGKELSSPHPLMIEAALREEMKARGITDLPEDPDSIFP